MIRTFNPNIIRHINETLQTKVESPTETKVEPKNVDKVEPPPETKVEAMRDESDDESDDEPVEKYKPKKISFLTLSDDEQYIPKKIKQVKPNISGKYLCECGANYTPSNKARHEQSFRHKCYIANQSSND